MSNERDLGDTTIVGGDDTLELGADASSDPLALVLIWSRKEPARVGELVRVPRGRDGTVFTIGRAIDPGEDGSVPLSFLRLRPYASEDTGPLRAAHVSRVQLRLRTHGPSVVEVEHVGRGTLRINGREVERALARPRDTIEVVNRFVLQCSTRPAEWPSRPQVTEDFEFGAADRDGIVGESPCAWELRERVAFVAERDEHALVYGPSGAGKELAVRAIHSRSSRGRQALVSRNASTLPEGLIDAELFGNIRNYPNPGMPARPGLLGEASGSTLYLDEVGELPHALQAHLLRVLDNGEYQRLGEARPRVADVRFIGATNRGLGDLKHDFLARVTHRVRVPGLTERPDDLPLLARHLLRVSDDATRRAALRFVVDGQPAFSPHLITALARHRFRGHVRELETLLWSAIEASAAEYIDVPPALLGPARRPAPTPVPLIDPGQLSRAQVVDVMRRYNGVKERVWRELGLRNRYQLKRLLRKLDLE
ncbi:MAG: sigma-54-dependent Fis family transcriptional regulator [Myxococcales bacterium]|nr:sigma-54-dependent Fis family transcriptional regulator [Myxococcales bacterium]MCB9753730.1 sigma-54-dependent Fis family transcriptional regulator [Myxococcales bacterium]